MRHLVLPGLACAVLIAVVLHYLNPEPPPELERSPVSRQERDSLLVATSAPTATVRTEVHNPGPDLAGALPELGSLEVRCKKAPSDGEGLEAVAVVVRSAAGPVASGITDDRGIVRFEAIAAGQYYLEMSHDSWLPIASNIHPRGRVRIPGVPVESVWDQVFACGFELRGGLVDARLAKPASGAGNRFFLEGQELMRLYRSLVERLLPKPAPEQRLTHVVKLLSRSMLLPPGEGDSGARVEVTGFHPDLGPCSFLVPALPVMELTRLTPLDASGHPVVERMCSIDVTTITPSGASIEAGDCWLFRNGMTPKYGFGATQILGSGRAWVVAGTYRLSPEYPWVTAPAAEIKVEPGDAARVELKSRYEMSLVRLNFIGLPRGNCVVQVDMPGIGYTPPINMESGKSMWLAWGNNDILMTFGSQSGQLVEVRRSVFVDGGSKGEVTIVVDVR
jgi:hypothetical protein